MRTQKGRYTSYRDTPPRHIPTPLKVAALVIVILVLGVFIGTRLGNKTAAAAIDKTKSSQGSSGADAEPNPGPTHYNGDVPLGYSHNVKGAVAAASGFVTVPVRLMLRSNTDAANAITLMSTPQAAQTLIGQLDEAYITVRTGFGTAQQETANPRIFMQEIPVGDTVVAANSDTAEVQIWVLSMAAIEGLVQPIAGWELHDVKLQWINGDWKVSDWSTAPGPTPSWAQAAPTDVTTFLNSVAPFAPYKYRVS